MKKILLVCTGNTCRSSMAKGMLDEIINKQEKYHEITVDSAGTSVYYNERANIKAVKVMEEMGIDISAHLSKPVDNILVSASEYILTMTRSQRDMLRRAYKNSSPKIYTLKEFAGIDPDGDISDPFGLDIDVYRKTAQELFEILDFMVSERKI
ncbi:MAG: low molecular weight protein arginine phosphatase [Eubacteriaceae bacterium]|nr:low molecular weight protein arginine phosphatase [Eubacteriaceae bacterium]